MASARLKMNKAGQKFYEIIVSRGRDKKPLTTRWYPPAGWSRKSIERELEKQKVEFERRCKSGEVRSKAEQKEQEVLAEKEMEKIPTVKQYGDKTFMANKTVTRSENTRDGYQRILDNWVYPRIGDVKMPEVTVAELSAVLLELQSEGKAHSSVVKCYAVLNGLFKMAYKTDVIPGNPMDKVDKPEPRKDELVNDKPEACDIEEMRYIMECLAKEPLKWRAYVWVLIDTGMRRGEACGIQWKYVDFENNRITIIGGLCYTAAKGVYFDTPKSRKKRTINVAPAVMDLLKELRSEQADHIS